MRIKYFDAFILVLARLLAMPPPSNPCFPFPPHIISPRPPLLSSAFCLVFLWMCSELLGKINDQYAGKASNGIVGHDNWSCKLIPHATVVQWLIIEDYES